MTPRQIQLVTHSFALVRPIAPQAAALFYDNLFAAAPALRSLFRGDMAQQGERLIGMIGSAVSLLDRPDVLMTALRNLGARHAGYGVVPAHYPPVGAALLLTLEQGLVPAFTADVRDAWAAMYAMVSRTMIDAAQEAAVLT